MSLYDTSRTNRDEQNDAEMEAEASAWNAAHMKLAAEMQTKGIDQAIMVWDDQTAYLDVSRDEEGDAIYAAAAQALGVSFEDEDRSFVNEVLEERFRDLYQLELAAQQ